LIIFSNGAFNFQHYDRIHAYQYLLFYNLLTLAWVLTFFLHLVSTGLSILGVQIRRPQLMLPQLILLLLRVGLLLGAFIALMTMNLVGEGVMLLPTMVVAFFMAASMCVNIQPCCSRLQCRS